MHDRARRRSTPAGSASPPSPPGSPRRRSTTRSRYAKERETVRPADHRPPGPGVPARRHGGRGRVGPGDVPARRPAQGRRAAVQHARPSIAKLVATDTAMKVTTDAVQVLGGYGYTRDFPVERYMREAKVMQIFEGTNQIQRMVIGRALAQPLERADHARPAQQGELMQLDEHRRPRHRRGVRPRRGHRRRPWPPKGAAASSPSTCPAGDRALADDRSTASSSSPTDVTRPEQVQAAVDAGRRRSAPLRIGRQLRRHRPVRRGSSARGRARPRRSTPTVIEINLVGTFNVLRAGRRGDRRRPTPDDRRARRHRQHRLHRGLRRTGRPGRVRRVQGRHRRPHPAGRPRPRAARHPGRAPSPPASSRRRCSPTVSDEFRAGLGRRVPFPQRLGPARASTPRWRCAIVDHDYLNGEVIRLDGALRMPPR